MYRYLKFKNYPFDNIKVSSYIIQPLWSENEKCVNYCVGEGTCSHPWPELTWEEAIFPAFLKDSTYISKISD